MSGLSVDRVARMLTRLLTNWVDPRVDREFALHRGNDADEGARYVQRWDDVVVPLEHEKRIPLDETPEARLLIAVIAQAFRDLYSNNPVHRRGAVPFFKQGRCDAFAEALGLDPSAVLTAIDRAIAAVGRPVTDYVPNPDVAQAQAA